MPLSGAFESYPWVRRAMEVRRRPVAAYGVAVLAVALATLVRWAIGGYSIQGVPFITYYPAIIIATLIGGLWAGMAATVLSTLVAWYLFIPPADSWDLAEREAVSLSLFVFISAINVMIVALLNAAVERVMAQEENLRLLIDSAPYGIAVVDQRGTITLVNEAINKLFGYEREELLGQSIDALVPPNHLAAHRVARERYFLAPDKRTFRDLSAKRKDGSEFPADIGLDPVSGNERTGVLTTVIDISDRKRAEAAQELIIRELQHRTRNLFGVFQALASRSLEEGKTMAQAKEVLNGRLQALAQAYAMLADAAWIGASLEQILDRQFAGFPERVAVTGCDIVVSPTAAQQFALIFHELATNAIKYGALSNGSGRVAIDCKVERHNGEDLFSFLWKETGGPPAMAPKRRGFGSVILVDSARQFAKNVSMDFEPNGLRYELELRLNEIAPVKNSGRISDPQIH